MINRVFFILDQELASDPGLPLPEVNVFYSIEADPAESGSLQRAYTIMSETPLPGLALALNLQAPLTADSIRSIGSFMFLPACLRIAGMPVIILTGNSADPGDPVPLLRDSATLLSSWLSGQGFGDLLIPIVSADRIFRSGEEFGRHYEGLLQSEPCYGHTLLFKAGSAAGLQSVLVSLHLAEAALRQRVPQLYTLIHLQGALEEKFKSLQRKYDASALELRHQQQYVDTLRSGHAAGEIQDFYTREYEILPLWYKRFGQVLKVLTGKRTLRSLFRDNTKKYNL